MTKVISSNWFKARAKLKIQIFIIEGHELEGMALNAEQRGKVKALGTYSEMLELAADFGLSCERSRVTDDKELAKDIPAFWADELIKGTDCDPCVRHKFGLKICAISDLDESLEETFKLEEAEKAEKARLDKEKAEKESEMVVNEEFIAENGHVDLEKLEQESAETQKIINNQPR